jgi:hypothetical protein
MIHPWTSLVVEHKTDNQSMQFLCKQWHVFLAETLDTYMSTVSMLTSHTFYLFTIHNYDTIRGKKVWTLKVLYIF